MESEERLSTRDIAGGGDTATERDASLADTPPADTAAVPPERADRDYDDGGAVAADRVADGGGEVVTDEPTGRGPSRESLADPADGGTAAVDAGVDDGGTGDRPAPAAAAAAAAPVAGDTGTRDTGDAAYADDATRGDTAASGTTRTGAGTAADGDGDAAPLLADAEGFQGRWEEIQVRFVDEPRGAVEDADALVATVMQRLAEGFAQERERLEAQWGRGEDISTEDLRVTLQRYRAFFQRLLSA
jgi:hypothetical protein